MIEHIQVTNAAICTESVDFNFLKILENCENLHDNATGCANFLALLSYKMFVLIPKRLPTAKFGNTIFPVLHDYGEVINHQ